MTKIVQSKCICQFLYLMLQDLSAGIHKLYRQDNTYSSNPCDGTKFRYQADGKSQGHCHC